jgi:ABC-type amino acid transport substrate-binding protein
MIAPFIFGATILLVLIGLRFTAWGRRTSIWLQSLASSGVEAPPTKFSEWVSFAGFGLTVVGVVITWYTISLQNRKASLEARVKDLMDQISTTQQRLQTAARKHEDFAPGIDIHLTAPIRDISLIGNHINFEWKYAKHTDHLSYLVEVLRKDRPRLQQDDTIVDSEKCDFLQHRSCRFYATAPTSQRSQLRMAKLAASEGEYLWRVVPAKARSSSSSRPKDEENLVSDWSEYGSFSFYPSLISRITYTKRVTVGTTYSDNVNFSSVDATGNHKGHDVDLIRIMVEGCLSIFNSSTIAFDDSRCDGTVRAYLNNPNGYVSPAQYDSQQLRVVVKPFPSVAQGLEALSRKETDVFIGSLTKAQERENDAIIFTDGYYDFETGLFGHSVQPTETLEDWLKMSRRVGVIDNSTNHWLATLLTAEEPFQNKLSVVAFSSFPAMESAFERRQIDGVLIDNVLFQELKNPAAVDVDNDPRTPPQDVWSIQGLDRTSAWKSYHARLGSDTEQFAIAVTTDRAQAALPRFRLLNTLFNLDLVRFGTESPQMGLYEPLQLALHSPQLVSIRSKLRTSNRLPPEPIEGVSFPTKP